ncbi:hypothetical protein [Prochlorothrix hollandica]|uniref:Uncharacterized protein n=1 Tax=Prochlorothrix hollandica PCC 9006 = CALU 1027 TaxID=317619 RepID=A0A0M2PTL3_PROHO|nr:hypothetical protein [Prochlorothrix hollandica]KKI99459.1 hypothetical protein PROH_12725 [Prochlorothrix hollandica PCC 9006 = CALU 1027]
MAYSDFNLSEIEERFQLVLEDATRLFPEVEAVPISHFLREVLEENIPLALAIHTEKARSEMIVTPILIEVRKLLDRRISLFSGVEFNVDKEQGLNGICDYLISLSKEQLYINSPVVAIVEAKNDNLKSGLAQCAAEMIAARIFNEQKHNPIEIIYGVVTTGSNWRFLKLVENRLYIDVQEYYLEQLGLIVGILLKMLSASVETESPS